MFPNLLTINNKLLFLVAFVLFLNVPPLVFSIIFVVYFAMYGHQLNVEHKNNENKNEDSDENIP
jgi:fatty acid desaturase